MRCGRTHGWRRVVVLMPCSLLWQVTRHDASPPVPSCARVSESCSWRWEWGLCGRGGWGEAGCWVSGGALRVLPGGRGWREELCAAGWGCSGRPRAGRPICGDDMETRRREGGREGRRSRPACAGRVASSRSYFTRPRWRERRGRAWLDDDVRVVDVQCRRRGLSTLDGVHCRVQYRSRLACLLISVEFQQLPVPGGGWRDVTWLRLTTTGHTRRFPTRHSCCYSYCYCTNELRPTRKEGGGGPLAARLAPGSQSWAASCSGRGASRGCQSRKVYR